MTEIHSGFVAVLGRPNVGKSSLVNAMCGRKVSIVAASANTTRRSIRGIRTDDESQLVFVDTPGLHKPKSELGRRLNSSAETALDEVDIPLVVVDATMPIGPGDRMILEMTPKDSIVAVNKCDLAKGKQIADQLQRLNEFEKKEYFPVSAKTGEGLDDLVGMLKSSCKDPFVYYPKEMQSDQSELFWIGELVREQLLRVLSDELPHSVACRVVEYDFPRIRVEILVERDSQKPIVIGRGGEVLKRVGSEVRQHLPQGSYLELFVKIAKNWQQDPSFLDELDL